MAYLIIFAVGLLGGISTIFRKNYVSDNINVKNSLNIYMLLAHPIAAVYFVIMAKGAIELNVPSFWFAFSYAFICIAAVLFPMMAYDKTNLVYISVFSSAGAMVVPFVFDMFRGETFTLFKYIAVVLRFGAVLIPLCFSKSKSQGLMICIILFFVSGIANIIPKLYGEWPGVVNDQSFCFWTNVIILPIIFAVIFKQSKPKEILADLKKIRPLGYVYIFLITAVSNVSSLVTIYLLRSISPTVYSILSSSFAMVLTALISVFIYKEEMSKQSLVSLIFSVGAIVLGVL